MELRKSWADLTELTVRVSQIETRILSVMGVADISSTVVNGIADNLVLGEHQVPVFNSISVL